MKGNNISIEDAKRLGTFDEVELGSLLPENLLIESIEGIRDFLLEEYNRLYNTDSMVTFVEERKLGANYYRDIMVDCEYIYTFIGNARHMGAIMKVECLQYEGEFAEIFNINGIN